MAHGNAMWILAYLSECKLYESTQGSSYSRRSRFLSLPVTERQLSARESPYLIFFLLKMVIKREDIASYCELQTRCLVLLQFPRCLETIMALQHLIMFDILLNPQLLRAFERNKYRRRNKHSAASDHHGLSHQECEVVAEKGVRLCKGPKRGTHSCMSQELACIWHIQLLKTHHTAHLWSLDKQRMIITWQVIPFCLLAFVNGQWHVQP